MDFADTPATADRSDGYAAPTVDYHEGTGSYRAEFDSHDRPPSEAVVTAVAAARECDPVDLPPLYSAVDPEALDLLFATAATRTAGGIRTATFGYADHLVTVNRHGTVQVERADSSAD